MTPQEQELIAQLFTRLKQTPAQPKDTEASDLIRRLVGEQPDAPYKLVQTVVIQDMALSQAQARIAELERQLGDTGPSQRGSFLPQSAPRGSVPSSGPWQRSAPQAVQAQPAPTQAGGSQPPMQSPLASAAPLGGMAGASSGFLRAAAATALGVAGGQLLFQGVESMFGQHAGGMLAGQPLQPSLTENVTNNFYGDQGGANPEEAADPTTADNDDPGTDPGIDDASDDDASDSDVASNDDGGDDSDDGSNSV